MKGGDALRYFLKYKFYIKKNVVKRTKGEV